MKNLTSYLYVLKIFKLLFQQARFEIGLKVVFAIIKSGIPLVQIYLTSMLINSINLAINNDQEFLVPITYVFVILFITLINSFFSEYETLLDVKIDQKVTFHIDELILNKITKLPLYFFEESINYDVMMRASSNPGNKGIQIITYVIDVARNIITISGLIMILFRFHWILVVSLLLVVIPHLLVSLKLGKKQYYVNFSQSENSRRAAYYFSLFRDRETAKELRIFKHSKFLLDKWALFFHKTIKEEYKLSKTRFKSSIFLNIFDLCMNFVFLATLIYVVVESSYTVGDYVSISQSLATAMTMVIMVSNSLAFIHNQLPYLKDFFKFLDFKDDTDLKKEHTFLNKIEVKGLSFKYPNSNKNILEDITFSINCGEKIAIVGENGSGKSTLVKCILGLYAPTSGFIEFDGEDLRNIDITKSASAVFQDFTKYSLTLKENIFISNLNNYRNNISSDEEILNYLNVVGGENIVFKTGGLDGELGVMFSNGNDLSGGEWQKVAITRALYKDANVIFFDEPTSSLDPIIESQILNLFHELTKDKTTVTVTHRLGSCKFADKIIVLHNGKIVEIGSHEELLNKNGYYTSMYKAQSDWYNDKTIISRTEVV